MLFRTTTQKLIDEIESFLEIISEVNILFNLGINDFIEGKTEDFQQRIKQVALHERRADELRRSIENDLYSHALLPDLRGDIVRLLERLDEIIDTAKLVVINFDIENPVIPNDLKVLYKELTEIAVKAVEEALKSSRTLFYQPYSVKDHLHKVYFYEKEADKLSDLLKRSIFSHLSLDLSQKIHLRYFAQRIDLLADTAEIVADMLTIIAIKQSI